MERHKPIIDSETGIWVNKLNPSSPLHDSIEVHKVDFGLRDALIYMLENQKSIVDFGCGNADYAMALHIKYQNVEAYDGNPHTPEMTGGFAKVLDLSEHFDLGKKFDCVISLEVAEHIPATKTMQYINNLINHCNDGVLIISWASKGQGGDGHVNEQNADYVKKLFYNFSYKYNEHASEYLRQSADLWWFKKTLMVFNK